MINSVKITKTARKELEKTPEHIKDNFEYWVSSVQTIGLEKTKKIPGFHDEALKGQRDGQRSIRLSRSWRAIYKIDEENNIEFILVERITNHDYRQ